MTALRRADLSIATYMALLVGLLIGVFVGVSALAIKQTSDIRAEMEDIVTSGAREELRKAITALGSRVEDSLESLASWDEIRQQVEDPRFYEYWRAHRLPTSGKVAPFISDVALYDAEGRPLGGHPGTDPGNEVIRVDGTAPGSRIVTSGDGGPLIRARAPVTHPYDPSEVLGYVEIETALPASLAAVSGEFRALDLSSLQIPGESLRLDSPDAVVQAATFKTRQPEAMKEVYGVARNALYSTAGLILAFCGVLLLFSRRFVAQPLHTLARQLSDVDGRAPAALEAELPVRELNTINQAVLTYQERLDEVRQDLEVKNRELWDLARRDPLTHVGNRRLFDEEISTSLAAGPGEYLTLVLIDCIHFKAINDTYGHGVGDAVLQELADVIASVVAGEGRVYRVGGDEFAVEIIHEQSGEGQLVAKRCIRAIRNHDFTYLGVQEPIRLSVGVAEVTPGCGVQSSELMRQADVAMYEAKRPGSGGIAVYAADVGTSGEVLVSHPLNNRIYDAIASGGRGLEMYYQPIVNLASNTPVFYEALVRIGDGDDLIMPAQIFPVLENRGMMLEFELVVLRRIRRDLQSGLLPADRGVSINLNGANILHDSVQAALGMLKPYMADHPIILEITETSLIRAMSAAAAHLATLRGKGFVIALDDFGSGYSSLKYLADMPVDIVKFDRALIHSLQDQPGKLGGITAHLAKLMAENGYQLVAEGIEDSGLAEQVRPLHFDFAQGRWFGAPSPLKSYANSGDRPPAP